MGGGDASVLIHSKKIILGVLIMSLVEDFHCLHAVCLRKVAAEHEVFSVHFQEAAHCKLFCFGYVLGVRLDISVHCLISCLYAVHFIVIYLYSILEF